MSQLVAGSDIEANVLKIVVSVFDSVGGSSSISDGVTVNQVRITFIW
jgi:hypothetical protein